MLWGCFKYALYFILAFAVYVCVRFLYQLVASPRLGEKWYRPKGHWGHPPGSWLKCARQAGGEAGFPAEGPIRRRPLPGSKRVRQAAGDAARLASRGIPVLNDTREVLHWLGLDLKALVALADPTDRIRPNRTNYIEWSVPKKRHGVRIICAPKPRLKAVQRRIKDEILDRAALHPAAHGFVRQRSIITNAGEHVGKPLVVNLDLRDFFEHIRYPRVVGVFCRLGYSLEVSRWLALLCTHRTSLCPATPTGVTHVYVRRACRHAVQGAPTSPALANLVVQRLDRRLEGLARRFEATYTRYADDLTFSGGEPFKRGMKRFLALIKEIIRDEGFRLHLRKMRFMRPGQRQQVTGVVVNEKLNIRREEYDRLKAILHNAGKAGLAAQNRDKRLDFRAYLLGRIAHVGQLNPARGERLLRMLAEVR